MSISEEKAAEFLRGRLSKFNVQMSQEQCERLLALCKAQGWKFTSQAADTKILEHGEGVKFAPGSEPHTLEALWSRLWEAA
jgi:hypothetical protein